MGNRDGKDIQPLKLTPDQIMVKQLDRIARLLERGEGRVANLMVTEHDLATLTHWTYRVDWQPDHFVIWMRYLPTAFARIALGDSVDTGGNAFEIANGMGIKIGCPVGVKSVSFYNNSPVTDHLFVVSVGGGLEMDLLSAPLGV